MSDRCTLALVILGGLFAVNLIQSVIVYGWRLW